MIEADKHDIQGCRVRAFEPYHTFSERDGDLCSYLTIPAHTIFSIMISFFDMFGVK